jgi:hypothetical protein
MTDATLAFELYASAVVATRHCFARLAEHEPPLAELDHVAGCIARMAHDPALTIAVPLAAAANDDPSRAVQCAFIAARVAQRAGATETATVGAVLAALLVDSGRARLASGTDIDLNVFSELPDSLDVLAPAATVALAITGAKSELRQWAALSAFEVAWLERPRLGELYQGELSPRLLSRIIVACRALLVRVSPKTRDEALSPFTALRQLCSEPGADHVALGLLARAIGAIPVGTVVELTSRDQGVVGPEPNQDPKRPALRTLGGQALEGPSIVRVVEPEGDHPSAAFALLDPVHSSSATDPDP